MLLTSSRIALAHLQLLPIGLVLNLLQIHCERKAAVVEMLDEYFLPVPPINPITPTPKR